MAFVTKNKGKWSVDFTDPINGRQRHIVGDGSSRTAAEAEAKAINQKLKAAKETKSPTQLADTSHVIEAWLDEHRSHLSAASALRYEIHCRHFNDFFTDLGLHRWHMINETAIERYQSHRLKEAGPKTVYCEVTALRTLCSWAVKRGYAVKDFSREVKKPKLPKVLPFAFSVEHQKSILAACKNDKYLQLLICLGLYAGLRRSGALGLKVHHVDLAGRKLRVMEKGEKERVVDIHPDLLVAFKEYPPQDRVYWFGGQKTKEELSAFSTSTCDWLRRVTGLPADKATFHTLRHTFCTNLLNNGVPIHAVQRLAGHASIETTAVYLALVDADRAAAIGKLPSLMSPDGSSTPQPSSPEKP